MDPTETTLRLKDFLSTNFGELVLERFVKHFDAYSTETITRDYLSHEFNILVEIVAFKTQDKYKLYSAFKNKTLTPAHDSIHSLMTQHTNYSARDKATIDEIIYLYGKYKSGCTIALNLFGFLVMRTIHFHPTAFRTFLPNVAKVKELPMSLQISILEFMLNNADTLLLRQYKAPTCPICFELFTEELACTRLNCGHLLCSTCLPNILNNSCPLCRAQLNAQEFLRDIKFEYAPVNAFLT